MKYLTFNIKAENKHSRGQKVDRPIMFELHDITDDGFTFRFRDVKLKHCTCSLHVKTRFNILDDDNELNASCVVEFLSTFFKYYYTYAELQKKHTVTDWYDLSALFSEDFVDFVPMAKLKEQLDDNSISPTVIKGIIDTLEDFMKGKINIDVESGEKTKNVQTKRMILDFNYDYVPVAETVNA